MDGEKRPGGNSRLSAASLTDFIRGRGSDVEVYEGFVDHIDRSNSSRPIGVFGLTELCVWVGTLSLI